PSPTRSRRGCGRCSETLSRPMPSARKRGARSSTPRGPARTPRDTDRNTDGSAGARGSGRASRATRVGVILVVLLAAAGGVLLVRGRRAQGDLQPRAGQNVLLITIDTLRADALSAYGGPAATPALDMLAGEGV